MQHKVTKEQLGLPKDRMTPTMLQCYLDCPLNFYYKEWLGLKLGDDDRMHMEFGNAVQDSIEMIYALYDNHFGGAWEATKNDFQKIQDYFKKKWTKQMVPQESFDKFMRTNAGKESGYTRKEDLWKYMYDDGMAILKSYWAEKDNLIAAHGLDLDEFEVMLKVDMVNPADPTDVLPVPISGRIDAKNRTNTKLIDFKTSKGAYNEDDSRKLMQCRAYPFMWLMKHKVFIPNFDYVVLRKGIKNENRVQVINLTFSETDMLEFFVQVKTLLQLIANREFSRPRSGHQNFCDCYKFEELLNVNK